MAWHFNNNSENSPYSQAQEDGIKFVHCGHEKRSNAGKDVSIG